MKISVSIAGVERMAQLSCTSPPMQFQTTRRLLRRPEQQLEYTRFASAILKLADSRNQESATLAALRDVLLPELMSGRGPVPGANQALAVIT